MHIQKEKHGKPVIDRFNCVPVFYEKMHEKSTQKYFNNIPTLFKLHNGGSAWCGIFGDQRVTAAHTVN